MPRPGSMPLVATVPTVWMPQPGMQFSIDLTQGSTAMGIRARRGNVVVVSCSVPSTATSNAAGMVMGEFQFRGGNLRVVIPPGLTRFVMPDDELLDLVIIVNVTIMNEAAVTVWLEGDVVGGDPR